METAETVESLFAELNLLRSPAAPSSPSFVAVEKLIRAQEASATQQLADVERGALPSPLLTLVRPAVKQTTNGNGGQWNSRPTPLTAEEQLRKYREKQVIPISLTSDFNISPRK